MLVVGMIGEYARLTPDELARALADPDWAQERVDYLRGYGEIDTDDDPDGADGRPPEPDLVAEVHKTWDILRFLLSRAGAPVDVVLGGTVFAADDDWGYGPPRYLTPAEVAEASAFLSSTPYDDLIPHFDAAEMARTGVYPGVEQADLRWPESWYENLVTFFAGAAKAGDAVVLWLD